MRLIYVFALLINVFRCRFVKVMAMVWAGSQVTKIIRAGGLVYLKLGLKLNSLSGTQFPAFA